MEDESNIDSIGLTSAPAADSPEVVVSGQTLYQNPIQPPTQSPTQSPIATPENPNLNSQIESKPKYRLKIVLPFLISIFLVILAALFYFVLFVPGAQAKVFVSEVSKDFDLVRNSVKKVGTDYSNVSNSFEISKGSFFEIPNLRTYSESKIDTAQDVINIKDTISAIDAALEHKASLHIPLTVEDLNTKIDRYYGDLKSAMNILLDYENFQVKMLEAEGDEYNAQLEKFPDVYKAGVKRTDLISYFAKLVELGNASVDRLRNIGAAPQDQEIFYHYVLDSDKDRTDSIRQALVYLSVGNTANDALSQKVILDYLGRQDLRNKNNKENADNIVRSSQLRTAFDKAMIQEESLKEGLSLLRKKYGIEQSGGEFSNDATVSAFPKEASTPALQPAQ